MDISNKTLAMFLLAAIVVSLGSTIFSMDKISKSPTGYATQATGQIDLSVSEQLSITTDSTAINFQSCTPLGGGQNLTINSETYQGATGSANCTSYTTVQNISVRNDGNQDTNVSVSPDDVGEAHSGTFVPSQASSGSSIAYKATNVARQSATYAPGCYGTLQDSYNNLTNAANNFPVCSNLTYKDVNSAGKANTSITTDVQIVIPFDATPGSDTLILTFTANAIA